MEGRWDELFDESYLARYVPFLDEDRTRAEALGAVALTGLAPGAEVLDAPCGFARHALVLAVLRPGGALVVETMHRDRLAHVFRPRHWDHLPDAALPPGARIRPGLQASRTQPT